MSSDFVKIYPGFFEGSLRDQPPFARLLFLAMLARADENGVVLGATTFWAAYVGITAEQVDESLRILSSPDPDSTTPDCEGRRIERWGDGANRWRIVNYRTYYEKSRNEERRAYKAEWAKTKRKCGHAGTNVDSVDPENESENENESKAKTKEDEFFGIEVPSSLDNPQFRAAWKEWCLFRREKRSKLTPTSVGRQLKLLASHPTQAVEIINLSITNGYTGLFPPKEQGGQGESSYEKV